MAKYSRRYNTVAPSFWNDATVRGFSEDGRTLALYLLTNQHRAMEGFYVLPRGLALDDLQWEGERYDAAAAELTAVDFAAWDEVARLVLIVKALKHAQKISGWSAIKGALTQLDEAKGNEELFGRFLAAADKYQPELAAAIRERYGLKEGPYQAPSQAPERE